AAPLHARITATDPPGLLPAALATALAATAGRPALDTALAGLIPAAVPPPGQPASLRDQAGWQLPRTRAALAALGVAHQREHGQPRGLAHALSELGLSLRDLGRHQEALDAFK